MVCQRCLTAEREIAVLISDLEQPCEIAPTLRIARGIKHLAWKLQQMSERLATVPQTQTEFPAPPTWELAAAAASDLENALGFMLDDEVLSEADGYTAATHLRSIRRIIVRAEQAAIYTLDDYRADAADAAYSAGEIGGEG